MSNTILPALTDEQCRRIAEAAIQCTRARLSGGRIRTAEERQDHLILNIRGALHADQPVTKPVISFDDWKDRRRIASRRGGA